MDIDTECFIDGRVGVGNQWKGAWTCGFVLFEFVDAGRKQGDYLEAQGFKFLVLIGQLENSEITERASRVAKEAEQGTLSGCFNTLAVNVEIRGWEPGWGRSVACGSPAIALARILLRLSS